MYGSGTLLLSVFVSLIVENISYFQKSNITGYSRCCAVCEYHTNAFAVLPCTYNRAYAYRWGELIATNPTAHRSFSPSRLTHALTHSNKRWTGWLFINEDDTTLCARADKSSFTHRKKNGKLHYLQYKTVETIPTHCGSNAYRNFKNNVLITHRSSSVFQRHFVKFKLKYRSYTLLWNYYPNTTRQRSVSDWIGSCSFRCKRTVAVGLTWSGYIETERFIAQFLRVKVGDTHLRYVTVRPDDYRIGLPLFEISSVILPHKWKFLNTRSFLFSGYGVCRYALLNFSCNAI